MLHRLHQHIHQHVPHFFLVPLRVVLYSTLLATSVGRPRHSVVEFLIGHISAQNFRPVRYLCAAYISAQNDVFRLLSTANNTDFKGAIALLTSTKVTTIFPTKLAR
ncbi:hypothetical protein Har1129_00715 [Haloarcula sp. CBA1129]|nr:hypothetical protein Har1129_00715 [Haloarcula sp. CBA1129]